MARKSDIEIPFSGIKQDILKILKKNKYIADYEAVDQD